MNIFPNPFAEFVTVEMKGNFIPGKTLKVYSLTGSLVLEQPVKQVSTKLNFKQLPAGMYFIRIGQGKDVIIKKVIKL